MSAPVRTIYIELRASAEKLRADMVAAGSQVLVVGAAGEKSGHQMAAGMDHASVSVRKVAAAASEGAVLVAESHSALNAVVARYGTTVAASGSATETLVDTYRALRLALSPTPFTVATIAAGILTEEYIRLISARAKLIEQQALISAISGQSMEGIDYIHEATSLSHGNEQTVQGLIGAAGLRAGSTGFNQGLAKLGLTPSQADTMEWSDFFSRVAEGFDSILDPAQRAALAVQLFGKGHAAEALEQLTPAFAKANQEISDFGLGLDEVSRSQIYTFSRDMRDLKAYLTDWSELRAAGHAVQQYMEVVGAAIYVGGRYVVTGIAEIRDRLRRDLLGGLPARLATAIGRTLPLIGTGPGGDVETRKLSHADLSKRRDNTQGLTADDLFAESQGAAFRQSQTLAGRIAEQKEAQQAADSAYATLLQDQAKRHENHNDPTLMGDQQRFELVTDQQSKASLAATLQEKIRGARQAPELVSGKIAANEQETESARQAVETQIKLARMGAQAEIDAMHDPHARQVAEADADVTTARERLARLQPIYQSELKSRIALINERAKAEGAMEGPEDSGAARIRAEQEITAARAQSSAKTTALIGEESEAAIRASGARATASREYSAEFDSQIARGFDELDRLSNEAQARSNNSLEELGKVQTRANEIAAEGNGATRELQVTMQKLRLERDYQQQIGHTGEQQISYLNKIITLEQTARAEKLAGLQAALKETEGSDDPAQIEKAASLQAQINKLKQDLANAGITGQTQLDKEKRGLSLKDKLTERTDQIPGQLGGALASGIMDGKGIGRDIRESLKGIGKEMLGDIFTKAIEELIIAITGQTIATNAQIVATTLYTWWLAIKGFLGFAAGGDPPVGVPSVIGERGPELFVPRQAGTIIPNNKMGSYLARLAAIQQPQFGGARIAGLPDMAPAALNQPTFNRALLDMVEGSMMAPDVALSTRSHTDNSVSGNHTFNFHLHGVNDPDVLADMVMRKLPGRIKSASPAFKINSK
ncbi:MAG TPA: hypothetical protein VG273_21930 [Bryobacteraceae bacterium]|jgi:hypothetical protein|nr:hypothetical protein [Bryobacteraceae bacterium]